MEQQTGPYRLHENESIPYPRVRRGIIIVSFLLMVIWAAVIIFYAYKDPNIICGTSPSINMLTYIMLGTSVIGIGTYLASPDSQLKVKSWIRRIPMFWNSIIDSGYTPYFDPDYFEIKNGHYVRVQSNVYDADDIGLPKVDAVTPLNSFNMTIYRKYHQPAITKAKSWQIVNNNLAESLLRKFIIERTRIVLAGHSCLIVKAWSGEHLLIHKSKYQDFINDQRATTIWPSLDPKRAKALTIQEKYIEGLRYMSDKLVDPTTIIPITVPVNEPIRVHYDQLITEMAAINSSIVGADASLHEVFKHMITDSQVPQSWKAVDYKCLELKMAALAKRISHQLIQSDILDKLKPDELSDQTEYVLNSIRDKMISSSEYQLHITTDPRLAATKMVLEKLALGSVMDVHNALASILVVSPQDQYPIQLKVLQQYATKGLKPHISAYQAGYKHLHGVQSVLRKINTKPASKTLQSLWQTIKQAKLIEAIPIHHIAANTQKFMAIEVAKANVATKELQANSEQYQAISNALRKIVTNTAVSPDIKQIQAKHEMMKTDADRAAISIANQKYNLERKLQIDAELLQQFNKLKPQLSSLQATVLRQSSQLLQLETKADQSEQQLTQTKLQLAQAMDERDRTSALMNNLGAQMKQAELATKQAELAAITIDASRQAELATKQNEIITIQSELAAKQVVIQNNIAAFEAATETVRTLQETVIQKENALNADKQLIEQMDEQLSAKTNELRSVTDECREKAIQLAQMAQDLKTFEERNVEMAKSHELMLKTFQQEGDQKLMQITSDKDHEIQAIKQEAELAKQSLASVEAQKNDLAIALQATQENATKLNAQKTIASNTSLHWKTMKAKRMQQLSDAQYRELLQKFNDKTQLEVQLEPIKASLQQANDEIETLRAQVAAANEDQSTTIEEREALIRELEQRKTTMEQSANTMKATISSNERTINKYKSELAALEQAHALKLQEVDKALAKEHAHATRLEAELNDKIAHEQAQASELQQLSAQLQALKQKAETETQRIREELIRSTAIHAEDMKAMQDSYAANLDAFKEFCGDVVDQLNDYKSVIKLPLVFSPRRLVSNLPPHNLDNSQVLINLDLPLIMNMNDTLNDLLAGTQRTYNNKHPLFEAAKILYPSKCAPDTFLDVISGKILEYIYTMYDVINSHKGITRAIAGLNRCPEIPKDQYNIIKQCDTFRQNAHQLFDNKPETLLEIISELKIKQLTDQISIIRSNGADQTNVYTFIFKRLDAYTYKYNENIVATKTHKVKKEKRADTPQQPSGSKSSQDMVPIAVDMMELERRQSEQAPPVPPRVTTAFVGQAAPSISDSTRRMHVNPAQINELPMPVKPKGNSVKWGPA
jgi:hypothetical protein